MTSVAWNDIELVESIIDGTVAREDRVANASARTMTEHKEDIWSDHSKIDLEWGRKSEDATNQKMIVWSIDEIKEMNFKEIYMCVGERSKKR
jgi:hypothetical protein